MKRRVVLGRGAAEAGEALLAQSWRLPGAKLPSNASSVWLLTRSWKLECVADARV